MKQQRATERSGHWSGILLVAWFLLSHFCAHAQVSGYVFRDFNADGIRTDHNPIEPGVAGATVRVFVDVDPIPRTTLTRADGTFSFDATAVPPGQPLRIEFRGFEQGYYTGPFGAGSGTTVQFLTSGASATAVYAGINYPADYCQKAPPIVTPCYANGDPLNLNDVNGNPITDDTKKAALADVLVSIPFGATGIAGSDGPANTPGHLAIGREAGTIWGVAFQRRTGNVFSGATIKRHAGLGPLGTGGIYTTDMNNPTPVTTPFIDVRSLGVETGDNPHDVITGNKQEASRDIGTVDAVGKRAIGGVDISEDDESMYFVNLNDRKIYNMTIGSPATKPTSTTAITSWTLPDPGCVNGVFRPWALKNYRGKIYVGGVCTGELLSGTAVGGTNNATSDFDEAFAHRDDLVGYIYRFDPTLGSSASFEKVLTIPLSFTRGAADLTEDCINYKYWFPWTNKFAPACNTKTGTYLSVMWPQPIISDISFDDDGSLFIGMMDRFGFISGNRNLSPDLTDNNLYDGFTGGDLLRAQRNADGTFTLESNGTTDTRTNPAGVGNGQGPAGGEFFTDDYFTFYGKVIHDEILNGALTYVPGSGEVFSSAFDPYSAPDNSVYRSGGFKMLDPRTGLGTRSFVLYQNKPNEDPSANGTFGKAAGLGDAQALCEVAPIEIGNRIWYDDNRNGIQEAYETGIDNLTLTLHNMEDGGKLVGTQVTRNGGQFYFTNTTVSPEKIFPDHSYQIRLSADQLPTITINPGARNAASGRRGARAAATDRSYSISPYGQGDNLINSKGIMEGDFVKIDVTTGDYGQNAHIYDLSVYSCPILALTRKTVPVCEGARAPDITLDGKYFARFDKVQFVEFDAPQSGTAMYGPGGRVLGEFTPANFSATTAESFTLSGATISTAGANKYVYALVFPAPNDPACRPFDETVILIKQKPLVVATGGGLSCAITSITLTGQATNSQGGSLTGVTTYQWSGPNAFTANTKNVVVSQAGTYTFSAASADCPQAFASTVASVTADTSVPSLTLTASPSGTAAVGESLTLTTIGCTGGTLILSTPSIVTVVQGANLYSATCTNGSGCSTVASISVTGLVTSINVKAESICIKDTPYISYTVTAVNFVPQNDVTITIRKFADNSLVEVKTNQPFTGSFLYSGAVVDAQGNPIDWPGWELINDEWVQVDDGLRPYLKVSFSVNPTAEVDVDYPPPTPFCLSGPPHGLGDRVWKDLNADGVQDSGEPGIADVQVELYAVVNGVRSTSAMSTTFTDSQGLYLFPDLPFGSYQVRFVRSTVPVSLQPSPAFIGNLTTDSNADLVTGFSDVIVLSDTDTKRPNRTVDAGFFLSPCPTVAVSPTGLTLCPGQVVPSLTASLSYAPGASAATGDHIDFVYFTQLPTPTELASGGTLLQSVTPGNNGLATLTSTAAIQTSNPGNTPVYRYVYAIFRPGTSPSACTAVYAGTVIQISPTPEFSLTALSPTCSGGNANTDGQIRMLNFDTNAGLNYILSTTPITVPISAIPVPVLANGLLRGNIANPGSATTYYVRVNSPAGCVAEKQITLRPASCQCPTPDCLPVNATRIR
jgi:hypothetical protein